jgi:hypothetical protein
MSEALLALPAIPGPGDIIGGITDAVGGAVSSAASGVFNGLSEFLWGAGLEILQTGLQLADDVGTVNLDLSSGPLASVWPVTLGIGCSLAGILFYVQLVTVTARGGRGLLRALQGVAQFGIALAASAAMFALVLLVADGITVQILDHGLSSANFAGAFDKTGFSDTTANTVKGPALALLSVFGVIPIGLGFAFENVMRAATIYLLVAVIPITAAGLLSGNTRSWFWKTANWALAAIAIKPVMALALWVGVAIAGSGSGLAQLITGLALLFVSLWAPMALFKLFAFTSTSATDAFKSGWGQADVTGSQSGGSSDNSSTATTTMESSNEARYDSASDNDTSTTVSPTPNRYGLGDDTVDDSADSGPGPNLTKDDVNHAATNAGNATTDPTASWPTPGGGTDSAEDGSTSTPSTGPPRPPQGPGGGAGGGGAGGGGAGGGGISAEEAAAVAV